MPHVRRAAHKGDVGLAERGGGERGGQEEGVRVADAVLGVGKEGGLVRLGYWDGGREGDVNGLGGGDDLIVKGFIKEEGCGEDLPNSAAGGRRRRRSAWARGRDA